jgi:hypothetical protein
LTGSSRRDGAWDLSDDPGGFSQKHGGDGREYKKRGGEREKSELGGHRRRSSVMGAFAEEMQLEGPADAACFFFV